MEKISRSSLPRRLKVRMTKSAILSGKCCSECSCALALAIKPVLERDYLGYVVYVEVGILSIIVKVNGQEAEYVVDPIVLNFIADYDTLSQDYCCPEKDTERTIQFVGKWIGKTFNLRRHDADD